MRKSLFAFQILIFFLFSNIISAQSNSFQINGGIIIPRSFSNGFTGSLQYNYSLSNDIMLYLNSGFSSWDKHYEGFIEGNKLFETYSSDNHLLIPVYIGGRMNLHTNKLFTAFGTSVQLKKIMLNGITTKYESEGYVEQKDYAQGNGLDDIGISLGLFLRCE